LESSPSPESLTNYGELPLLDLLLTDSLSSEAEAGGAATLGSATDDHGQLSSKRSADAKDQTPLNRQRVDPKLSDQRPRPLAIQRPTSGSRSLSGFSHTSVQVQETDSGYLYVRDLVCGSFGLVAVVSHPDAVLLFS